MDTLHGGVKTMHAFLGGTETMLRGAGSMHASPGSMDITHTTPDGTGILDGSTGTSCTLHGDGITIHTSPGSTRTRNVLHSGTRTASPFPGGTGTLHTLMASWGPCTSIAAPSQENPPKAGFRTVTFIGFVAVSGREGKKPLEVFGRSVVTCEGTQWLSVTKEQSEGSCSTPQS